MIDPKWFTIVGLLFDIVGAIVLTYGLIVSKEKAVKLGRAYITSKDPNENLKVAPIADRIFQSRNAITGLILLIFGFLLQIVGAW